MYINRNTPIGYHNPRNAVWLGERSIKPAVKNTAKETQWIEQVPNPNSIAIQNNREEFDKRSIENVQVIFKKKKKRLPGESLVRKYTQDQQKLKMDTNENIENPPEPMTGGCMTDQKCPCPSSGETTSDVKKKKKKIGQKGRGLGSSVLTAVGNAVGIPGVRQTLLTLVEFLVRAFLRGTKLGTRGQVKKAKKILAESLTEAIDEIDISPDDSTSENMSRFSRAVSSNIGKKLAEVIQKEDVGEYESKKIHTGLIRILSKVAKGKLNHGDASTQNAVKQVANRAGKGFVQRCGSNPVQCLLGVAGVAGGIAAMSNPATAIFGVSSLTQGLTHLI